MGEETREQLAGLPYIEMGSVFLIGLAVGYFLKKSFKVLLMVVGMGLVLIFALEHQKVVTINEDALNHIMTAGSEQFQLFAAFLKERLEKLEIKGGISAVAGFFVGLKMG